MPTPRTTTHTNPNAKSRAVQAATLAATAALSAAAFGVIGITGCHAPDPPPFDPHTYQLVERRAATEVTSPPLRPLPTTLESTFLNRAAANSATRGTTNPTTGPSTLVATAPSSAPTTGPALGTEPQVRMSLQEIMQRAVINNRDIKVSGYQPAIDETRVIEAEARFDPTYFANAQYQKTDRQIGINQAGSVTQSNGEVKSISDIYQFQTGIRQELESGGSIEFRAQTSYNEYPRMAGVNPNPFWDDELVLQVTQPLLRDFGNAINRARITIAQNTQRISLLELRKQIEETTADIEKTYWQLVQAERNVRIQEELLNRTVDTAVRLLNRRGEVNRVPVSQANSRIESRRAELIRLKARVKDLSDQLKRDMNDPQFPVASALMVLPGAPPIQDPVQFNLKDQINTAMENRFELGEQYFRIDSAGIAAQVGKNNLLPALNIQVQLGTQGLDHGFFTATQEQAEFDNINWQVGFQFEIPIGNRAARAVYQRALLQRQQALESYRNLVDQISQEVKTAAREVETTWNEMANDRQAVFAAEDALRGLVQREESGLDPISPASIDTKLNQQQQLADAQRNEAEAISNYNLAIARLEQAKGTLLKYNNIVMKEESIPFNKKLAMMQRK